MDGFLVVDKPAGMTSHDVVSAVRRIARLKKVGHTGTLDPFATGVLPVALGEGTKAIPFLDESVKEYQAVMHLGASTDTQDFTGKVIRHGEWQALSQEVIEAAIHSFLGKGKQVPPMFSALKREGVPLYRLARRGEEVEREPRDMEIFSISVERVAPPEVSFTVRCSRGVYIRTLAHDIGDLLGCGAHLTSLRRSASGPFSLPSAVSLDTLAAAGGVAAHVISCCAALTGMQSLTLSSPGVIRVRHGKAPAPDDFELFPGTGFARGERIRLCCEEKLVAIAENGAENGKNLRLLRVFNEH